MYPTRKEKPACLEDSVARHEPQATDISIFETGVDWTHPILCGDPTPSRFGVAPPAPATTNNNRKVSAVISMSLGVGDGPDRPTAVAASNAAFAGTTVIAASGNSGPGESTTGSPAGVEFAVLPLRSLRLRDDWFVGSLSSQIRRERSGSLSVAAREIVGAGKAG